MEHNNSETTVTNNPDLQFKLPDNSGTADNWLKWLQLHRLPQSLTICGYPLTFTGTTTAEPIANSAVLSLHINEKPAWIEMPWTLLTALCKQSAPEINLSAVPPAYQGIFCDAAMSDGINQLQKHCDLTIEISHVYDSEGTPARDRIFKENDTPGYETVGLAFDDEEHGLLPVRTKLPSQFLPQIGRLLVDLPLSAEHYPNATLPIHCLHGETLVTSKDFTGLQSGDCVLFKSSTPQAAVISVSLPGNRKAAGTLHGNTLRLTSAPETMDQQQALDNWGEDVHLQFFSRELGVPLPALQALEAGSVLNVDINDSRVSVFAGGRHCGNGQLIEIDGHIGVRIKELF